MMAAGRTFSAQKALNTCADHEHEELDMYCKTCKKPVCTKCVKEDHRSHDWDTLAKIAKALRKDTARCKMEMQSVSQSILIGMEGELRNITHDEESQFALNQSEMETRRKAIIESVNTMFKEMKSKSEKDHKSKMKSIVDRTERMGSKMKRLRFLIQNMETGAKDYTDTDLIELHNEIKQLIKDLQNIARLPDSWYRNAIYKKRSFDKALLEMVGSIEDEELISNVILEREFTIANTPTNSIIPWSENEAWMHSMQTSTVRLLDNKGRQRDDVDLNCFFYKFAVSAESVVYVSDQNFNVIQVSKAGEIKVLFNTVPLNPTFVNLTRSGDLLVTLVDEESYVRNKSSRRLVRKVSKKGVVIKEYEYNENTKTPLFCRPCTPIEHPDGRICLIDLFESANGDTAGTVYCLDGIGKIVFKYNGIDARFNPLDICCASKGNTLVSDCDNKRIHILDSNGKFVRFLLTPEMLNEYIYGIACYDRTLWVGSRETGLIKVFKYAR